MESKNEELVEKAKLGSRKALEDLVVQIQDRIYGLALRMLYDPFDAEDAAQEILVKIVTHLGSFKGKSSFETWMYRVACNHLLTVRKRKAEHAAVSFEEYEAALDTESSYVWNDSHSEALENLIMEEVRISCLQGVLLCLDRDHRLTFLLSEIFDITGKQGAEILEISAEAFRKRLSRARFRMKDFFLNNCSLVNPGNPCQCERYAAQELENRRKTDDLVFANHPCRAKHDDNTLNRLKELNELNRVNALYWSYPEFSAPESNTAFIKDLIKSDKFELMRA